MKIEVRQLRQLIAEAMKTKDNATNLALYVSKKNDRWIEIFLYKPESFKKQLLSGPGVKPINLVKHIVGVIGAERRGRYYEVQISAARSGWGPFLYDKLMSMTPGLIPDQSSISDDARRIWQFYATKRSDVSVVKANDRTDEILSSAYVMSGTGPDTSWLELTHQELMTDPEFETTTISPFKMLQEAAYAFIGKFVG